MLARFFNALYTVYKNYISVFIEVTHSFLGNKQQLWLMFVEVKSLVQKHAKRSHTSKFEVNRSCLWIINRLTQVFPPLPRFAPNSDWFCYLFSMTTTTTTSSPRTLYRLVPRRLLEFSAERKRSRAKIIQAWKVQQASPRRKSGVWLRVRT